MTIDVTYWLDAASKLASSVAAETGLVVYVVVFAIFLTVLFVFVHIGTSRR